MNISNEKKSQESDYNNNNEFNSSSKSISLTNISLANQNINNNNEEGKIKNKKFGHFILGEKLGKGTFGFVRLATHTLTGEKVAIKILDKEKIIKQKEKMHLKNEIKILKKLRHSNIAQLYGVINSKLSINLIMEYAEGEELFEYLNKRHKLKEIEACIIFKQIISALDYLSKNNISHRDLKPENIIFNKDNFKIKIIDFGLSRIYKDNEMLKSKCGSLCFTAPEIISGKKYNGLSVDIWSSGVTLFSMICGFLPFQDDEQDILYQKIIKGKIQIPFFVSQNAKDLLYKILNKNPNKRCSIEQIKRHKWFKILDTNNIINEGLLLDKYVIPIDENVIGTMVKEYEFNEEEIKINILKNKHNLITTTYYLLLNKRIKEGKKSICDMTSDDFLFYLNDNNNLLENYDYNLDKVCQERVNINFLNKNLKQSESNKKIIFENNNMYKNDLFKEEINVKLKNKEINYNNDMNILYNNNEFTPSNSKIKKNGIKNSTVNEEINSKYVISYKNSENNLYKNVDNRKFFDYSNHKNKEEKFLNSENDINNKKDINIEKNTNINSDILRHQNSSKRNKRLRKYNHKNNHNNNNNVKKLCINTLNLYNSNFIKTKFNRNIKNSNKNIIKEFHNDKSFPKNYQNNIAFSERKNNIYSKIKDKDKDKEKDKNKNFIKTKRNRIQNDLILSNHYKDKKIQNKFFNSDHTTNQCKLDSIKNNKNNNNFSITSYENESKNIKSIFPRKNNNQYSICQINSSIEKIKSDLLKQKYKNKISIIIKPKYKERLREVLLNRYNCITFQSKEDKIIIKKNKSQKRNKKNDFLFRNNKIHPSNSVLIKKNNNNKFKKNMYNSCLNVNRSTKEIIHKNNVNKSILNYNTKNINNKIKECYVPFDLNSIIYFDQERNNINKSLYDNVCRILSKENVNYIIQKNKFVCWKNKLNFEIMILLINKNKNIIKINTINKNGKTNIFKDTINNIINQISKY